MNAHTTWSLTSALRMAKQVSVLIIYMPNGIWVSYKNIALWGNTTMQQDLG